MYLYYTMIVMSLTTLLDKKSPLFSELCLQSVQGLSPAFVFYLLLTSVHIKGTINMDAKTGKI